MMPRTFLRLAALSACLYFPRLLAAQSLTLEGAPADSGFNAGSTAVIRATLTGASGEPGRCAVFADIQYVGTTAVTSVQMDRQGEGRAGEIRYEAGWPVPEDAPTGLYSVSVRVEDRDARKTLATRKLRSFAVYRKALRIARVHLDKTFYTVGEPILCEVVLENLTGQELKNLRVEFSNANYPWISLYSTETPRGGQSAENPDLGLRALRERLDLPAHGQVTLPMMPAGTAAFLQGQQVAVLGAGGPARHEKVPLPEVDQYTLAVWNAERTVLYDMQFSPHAIVRAPDRDDPKPYSLSFTHRYNLDIDFKKYRHFYPPGGVSESANRAENSLPASLMVFCPHEDDEHAYAGLIRAAVEAGIPVRVIALTGGDVGACERYYSNPCGPNEAREFGMVRMEETAEALEHIGLAGDKLSFLGLPDGGSGAIWSKNLKSSDPFLSIYLATDHAPYENVLRPNLPFAREAVLEVLKQTIADFRPAMIATPHPDERHVDHRTTNWFVVKACQELLREKRISPQTIVLADRAYGSGGFKPAPYRYEKWVVHLSGEAAILKQEMGWIYQSQDGNLAEGMRKTFAELPREEVHYRIVDWQEHEGWNE